jgi:hypothetical protein
MHLHWFFLWECGETVISDALSISILNNQGAHHPHGPMVFHTAVKLKFTCLVCYKFHGSAIACSYQRGGGIEFINHPIKGSLGAGGSIRTFCPNCSVMVLGERVVCYR